VTERVFPVSDERWQGVIGDQDIQHATASAHGPPERAVEAAMAMARLKYRKPEFDWSKWDFRAELLATTRAETVHFRWEAGALIRIQMPLDRWPLARARRR
jgi:hypothetical protein